MNLVLLIGFIGVACLTLEHVSAAKKLEQCRKTLCQDVKALNSNVETLNSNIQELIQAKKVICPEGGFQRGTSCYIIIKVTATWGNAMEICIKDFGGHLAVIEDEDENNYLKQLARSETPEDRLWIDGTDAFKEGEWRWVTTMEIISSAKFTDWNSGEPNNGGGTEDCMELYPGFDFSWNDDKCYNPHKFICEIDVD